MKITRMNSGNKNKITTITTTYIKVSRIDFLKTLSKDYTALFWLLFFLYIISTSYSKFLLLILIQSNKKYHFSNFIQIITRICLTKKQKYNF